MGTGGCPSNKSHDTGLSKPGEAALVRSLVDRVTGEFRRHPGLVGPATAVAMNWAPAIDGLTNDQMAPPVVTEEMLFSLGRLLDAVVKVSDDRDLAAVAGRIGAVIRSGDLAGAPINEAIALMVKAAGIEAIVDDASLRLGHRERGLAREDETLVIPASAHAGGALGTRWRTDLVLTAAGGAHALVAIALLPRDQANPEPEVLRLEIDGGHSLALEDVLDTLFDFNGAAALRVTCESGTIIVTSRTYNLEGELGSPNARTFGQFVPALSDDDAIVSGDQGRLLLLAHDPSLERAQRTNLILVNGGELPIEVEAELFTSAGTSLGVVLRTLRAWEYRQVGRVFEEVTSAVVNDGYAIVRVTTAGGRAFALASVVDNLTGDPVAVPAVLRAPFEETTLLETQIIQAAAKIAGVGDTDWRTDLVLHGLTGLVTTASVELLPRGQENTSPASQLVQIPQGQSVRFNDVLQTLFSTDGAASIRVTPYGGAAGVSSRTYNLLGGGNAGGYPAGATFGQYLGPVGYTRSFTFGEEAWIPHLSHDPTLTKGSRANLGLVNNSTREIDVEVDLFQGDGTLLGGFTQTLRMWENVQIAKVFERVTTETVEGGYAVVRTTHPAGFFAAHGSVVDNRTGDPITVDAVAIRRPVPAGVVAGGDMLMQLFESGFSPGTAFEMLRSGGLADFLDLIAAELPDRVTRTADGIVFDSGPGSVVGGAMFVSGRVGLEDASVTDGAAVTGSVTIDFDQAAVDGRAPVIDDLELGLDLAQVAGDHVAGTVTLGSARLSKAVTDFGGSLVFDTRICQHYPIGGSITITIDGEDRTLTFTDSCDGSFQVDIPSAGYYSLSMSMRDCQGGVPADPQVVHLIDEDGQLSVDPSSPPDITGRRRFAATGRALLSESSVRFAQKAGPVNEGGRRVGGFQGQMQNPGGYYSGTYGYTVAENGCQSSYYHGRDDPDFVAGVLEECDGPCAE